MSPTLTVPVLVLVDPDAPTGAAPAPAPSKRGSAGAPRGGLARTGATTQGLPVAVAIGAIGVAGLWARRRNRYQSENK